MAGGGEVDVAGGGEVDVAGGREVAVPGGAGGPGVELSGAGVWVVVLGVTDGEACVSTVLVTVGVKS